jgi:hypothetical protein
MPRSREHAEFQTAIYLHSGWYIAAGDAAARTETDERSVLAKPGNQSAPLGLGYNINRNPGMGWDGVPASENAKFAQWIKKEVIDKYGLDGIDIDNEFSKLPENKPAFMDTVGYLRAGLPGSLISKALWQDEDYFLMPVSPGAPNAGKYLARLLDFGCTMGYGIDTEGQKQMVQSYHDLEINENSVGMRWEQLCIGVQAGSPELDWMTNIQEVYELAKWVVQPQSPTKPTPPILGMMLFTVSTGHPAVDALAAKFAWLQISQSSGP